MNNMFISYRELAGDDDSFPYLKDCLNMPCPEKAKVLNYLQNAGEIRLVKFGYDEDIFTKECIPGSDVMHSTRDEAYSWMGSLIWYFNRYDVKLPDAFVEYILHEYEKGVRINLCNIQKRSVLKAASKSVNRYNKEKGYDNIVFMSRMGIFVITHTADYLPEDVIEREKKAAGILRSYDYEPDEDIRESVYLFIYGVIIETELTDRMENAKMYLDRKKLITKYF